MYTLFTDSQFKGLPVTKAKGPLVAEYLGQIHALLCRALDHHRQLSTFRVELSVPQASTSAGHCLAPEDVARFIQCLEEGVRDPLHSTPNQCARTRSVFLRSFWARDYLPGSSRSQFSVIFLLSAEIQQSEGVSLDCSSLIRLVVEMWAAQLGITPAEARPLVRIPLGESSYVHSWDDATIEQFFLRASGLCRASSRDFQGAFGCSSH